MDPDAETKEWARNGSFMKKPATGWLHDDNALQSGDGVYYPVKYIGSVPMTMSMRTMKFEDRTNVTREAITMICEMANLRPPKKRKVSKIAKQCLQGDPTLRNLNVKFTISTTGIALVVIETNQVIANHIMPCISFATGGDAVDYDVIGYVAKDARNRREVHVFDCGHMAYDVMATIGQAFELRFKAFLKKGGGMTGEMGGTEHTSALFRPPNSLGQQGYGQGNYGEAVYDDAANNGEGLYDDLPGGGQNNDAGYMYGDGKDTYEQGGGYLSGDALYDNRPEGSGTLSMNGSSLYDNRPGGGKGYQSLYGDANGQGQNIVYSSALYDNNTNDGGNLNFSSLYDNKKAGDPGYSELPGANDYDEDFNSISAAELKMAPGAAELQKPLAQEPWFHGRLTRGDADTRLKRPGQFLVRESKPQHYILSAAEKGVNKHILLVDPSGVCRTKDMRFANVSHLINYHIRARIPIVAGSSRINLTEQVPRPQYTSDPGYHAFPQ